MSIKTLAPETLEEIFEHLPSPTVFHCMMVCKSWFVPAAQKYYRRINLQKRNKKILRKQLPTTSSLHGSHWVKELTIGDFELHLFAKLLHLLPNLTIINITANFQKYLKCIEEGVVADKDFLQHIQHVNFPTAGHQSPETNIKDIYLSICFQRHQTIRELHLNFLQHQYTVDDKTGTFLDFLPDFPLLTDLTLYNGPKTNGDPNLLMFSIVDACTNLMDLHLDSRYPVPETLAQQQLLKYIKQRGGNHNNSQLKNLFMQLPTIPTSYMKYITACTPTGMDQIVLRTSNASFDDWILQGGLDKDTFAAYAQHLGSVKGLLNLDFCGQNNTPFNQDDGPSPSEMKFGPHPLLQLAGNIKGNKDIYCAAHLNVYDYSRRGTFRGNNLRMSDGILKFFYDFPIVKFLERCATTSTLDECIDNAHDQAIKMQDMISINMTFSSYARLSNINKTQMLNLILTNCPRLAYLNLMYRPESGSIILQPTSVYPLPKRNIFSDIDLVTSTNDMVTKVVFQSLNVDQDMLQVLTNHLSNITKLAYRECQFTLDSLSNATMELQAITQLDCVLIRFDKNTDLFTEVHGGGFIRLLFSNGDEAICFELKKTTTGESIEYDLARTTMEYIEQQDALESRDTVVLTIQCHHKIKKFSMSFNHYKEFKLIDDA